MTKIKRPTIKNRKYLMRVCRRIVLGCEWQYQKSRSNLVASVIMSREEYEAIKAYAVVP